MTQNLILITADAWRADFVDQWEQTPLITALSARWPLGQARFTRAYSAAPWTSPAVVSLMTGQDALRHGVWHAWDTPRPGTPALASRLGAAGYQAPSLSYLNRVNNYFNLGFEADSSPTGAEPALLLRAIEETPEPFFLWFHYKWTHLPYWGSEGARARLGLSEEAIPARLRGSVGSSFVLPRGSVAWEAADARVVRGLYASNVLDLDAWLGEVLEAVQRRGVAGRTTLALTSDHGEELLERGHVGHASTAHHGALYEESLRVPLFVLDARLPGARVIDAPTQSVDLFPTLLGLLGVEAPASDGLDLSAALLEGAPMPSALFSRVMWFHSARAGYLTPREQEGHEVLAAALGDERVIWERYGQERWMYFDLATDPDQRAPRLEGEALEAWKARLLSRRSGAGSRC